MATKYDPSKLADYVKTNVLNHDWSSLIPKTQTQAQTQTQTQNQQAAAAQSAGSSVQKPSSLNTKYTAGASVQNAQNAYQQQAANKPAAYQSQWQKNLDDTIAKILNREEFSYDLNGDALYQQYKDQYTQQGKMAMLDTMGQAQAMTGGYGNSYAQTVGQQAYQGYLQDLNDMIPELYQLALDKYQMEGEDLYNQYGLMSDRENQDYSRYRDDVSDYNTELDRLYNQYVNERDFDYEQFANDRQFDYNQYVNDRDYDYQVSRDQVADQQWQDSFDYQKSRDEVADSQWQSEFDYQKGRDQVADAQWDQTFQYQQDRDTVSDEQWLKEFEYQQLMDQIANDQWNQSFDYQKSRDETEDSQWQQSMDYQKSRDQISDSQWQAEYDEDKRRYDQEWEQANAKSSGSGGSGGSSGSSGSGSDADMTELFEMLYAMEQEEKNDTTVKENLPVLKKSASKSNGKAANGFSSSSKYVNALY